MKKVFCLLVFSVVLLALSACQGEMKPEPVVVPQDNPDGWFDLAACQSISIDEGGCLSFTGDEGKCLDDVLTDYCVKVPGKLDGIDVKSVGNLFRGSGKVMIMDLSECDGIESIDTLAFAGCINLKKVVFPPNLKTIGTGAFSDCVLTDDIVIPKTVEKIGAVAFSGCGFVNFSFEEGSLVKEIGPLCFAGCRNLESFAFPEGVEKVEDAVFFGCTWLANVSLPRSVKSIGSRVFLECRKDEDIDEHCEIRIDYAGNVWEWNEICREYNWNCRISDNDVLDYTFSHGDSGWAYDSVAGTDRKFYTCLMNWNGGDMAIKDSEYARGCISVHCAQDELYDEYEPLLYLTSTPATSSHEYIDTGFIYDKDGTTFEIKYVLTKKPSSSASDTVNLTAPTVGNFQDNLNLSALYTNVTDYNYDGIGTNPANSNKAFVGLIYEYASTVEPEAYGNDGGYTWTAKYSPIMYPTVNKVCDWVDIVTERTYTGQDNVKMNFRIESLENEKVYVLDFEAGSDALMKPMPAVRSNLNIEELFRLVDEYTLPLFCGRYVRCNNKTNQTLEVKHAGFIPASVYYYKLYDHNGDLKVNLVPCVEKESGEIGMLDLNKKEFHEPQSVEEKGKNKSMFQGCEIPRVFDERSDLR